MSTFRRAQAEAHPSKTNTVLLAIVVALVVVVSMQVWLLTAGLNTALGGDRGVAWPAFYASLALFGAAVATLRYLPRALHHGVDEPVRPAPATFVNAALAWRTLGISAFALALAFSVWFLWSALALKLAAAGFQVSASQKFWLTATPVLLGSLLRIPYGVIVSRYGSRKSFAVVTALLAVPCVGAGLALRDPRTSFETLLFWSAVTGIAGANFATSMAVVTLWFPKAKQGLALGINGLGNFGVTAAQFTIPAVIGTGVFAALTGPSQLLKTPKGESAVWLQNAAFVWIPFVLLAAAAIWFWTEDFKMAPKTLSSQLVVAKQKHTWILSFIYFLTFGCFVAMGASLPLIIQSVFANAPGGAPSPLVYAPFAPLVATIMRPLGGWAADRWGAGNVTLISIAVMAVGGISLSRFLTPDAFSGFFGTILVICAASGLGNGSVFKIIPVVNPKEAGAVIGFVSCLGALGGFVPPLLLGWCLTHWGSPAWAYIAMSLFAVTCFATTYWFYARRTSPTRC